MRGYNYYDDKPISAWGYVGYSFLWAIPVLGWLLWLCAALFAKNPNKKNFARSYVCAFIVALLLVVVVAAVLVVIYMLAPDAINQVLQNFTTTA